MAVVVESFDDWYVERVESGRDGCLEYRGMSKCADQMYHQFLQYKREMEARIKNYEKLVMIADAEVINPKSDLPNISSGETAGMIRRMARNLVQHTPNVDIVSKFDDDKAKGIFVRHILKTKIIGDDHYSNDMQQNLFASAKNSLTLGFDCVIPALLQDAAGGWYVKYDNIHYQDVFPEPGARDVRHATDVFVRRYLTKGEVLSLVRNNTAGWDIPALKLLLKSNPSARETNDHQSKKHHTSPDGYEIITWYSASGAAFLTFDARQKLLLRIEKNKHPLKWHPVFFLVMEKDLNQPLGKSQVELVMGRQEFQDLMLNGAMKMWYRNINPPLIGYGTVNAIPNLSPGKYTPISNPNAKVEAFEVNTQTLMQYGQISQQNAGNMVQLVGAADQQMATQNTGGQMSNTAPGVEAQQQMVDITTNNYQKSIESFFSRYCSYALTIFFHELKGIKEVSPTADTREALLNGGLSPEDFDPDTGNLKIDFSDLATEYFVRTIPGSLVEMEDEKQLRILNEMFVPLSQAMPAIAAAQDPEALKHATKAMQFIIEKQLELSGSTHSRSVKEIFSGGVTPESTARDEMQSVFDSKIEEISVARSAESEQLASAVLQIQEQIALLAEGQGAMMQQIGIPTEQSAPVEQGVPV